MAGTYGKYCERAGQMALLTESLTDKGNYVCSERVSVKGDGIKSQGDNYGEPYVRSCEKAKDCPLINTLHGMGFRRNCAAGNISTAA